MKKITEFLTALFISTLISCLPIKASNGLEELRILVVDDSAILRSTMPLLLRSALEGTKHSTETAESPSDALKKLEISRPHFIITDVEMGENMNGIDLVTTIRSIYLDSNIYFVVMSGNKDFKTAALEAGANVFIEKPIRLKTLTEIFNDFLASRITSGIHS